ncbi:hypothetical protein WME98_20305 [Sorangium sp. So ce296]|uniref:acyl carrier protein n=1 Tax=Sorangium sp. So ce296 TaxID=3133296 RepID=UPI003F62C030
MTKEDIKSTLRDFILSEFLPGESPANLKDDTDLRKTGILDSMGTLKTVYFVESQFNMIVEAMDAGADNFGTIDAIATFVDERLRSR